MLRRNQKFRRVNKQSCFIPRKLPQPASSLRTSDIGHSLAMTQNTHGTFTISKDHYVYAMGIISKFTELFSSCSLIANTSVSLISMSVS